jgi:acetyltransferase EpsM
MHEKSRKLVIFGFGGLARELWGWIRTAVDDSYRRRVAAFVIDATTDVLEYDTIPVLDRDAADRLGEVEYFLAVSDPSARRRLSDEFSARGWEAANYVHETVIRGRNVSMGVGTLVFPRCSISSDVDIGAHVLINGGTAIGHDCRIGDYSSLLGGISLNGRVTIGASVLIGAGAIVYPGKRIHDGATVGMGSVVFRDVAAGQTVYGNPAQRLD